tara:strand:+ start:1519 stop:1746 length:228 start_codon:yes stop_codon:yes gene_type:complete
MATRIQNIKKKYYNLNKEKILLKKKEYRLKNISKINEKFTCDCNGKYTTQHKSCHMKTKKHLNFIEQQICYLNSA